MASISEKPAGAPARSPQFQTTHWSVVLAADGSHSPQADEAIRRLCEAYRSPVYCFVRRAGNPPAEAQDLTQEFFHRLLAKDFFAQADPARGRFRNFLLASLKNFLRKSWRDEHRQERGGGVTFISLDADASEGLYATEPQDHASPDRLYERRYALALLESVLTRLSRDYARSGRAATFEHLQHFLWGRDPTVSYSEMASRLGLTEGAVKVAIHRLRGRYRELLLEEVARTVAAQSEVEEELRHLLEAVSV